MIKPTGFNVLVTRDKQDEITKGGIIVPEVAQTDKIPTAVVKAIGPKVTLVKVGDRVMVIEFVTKGIGDDEMVEEKYIQAIVEEA